MAATGAATAQTIEEKAAVCSACHGENGKGGISAALVGGGPMEAALKAQAAQLGLADRIHFVGRVPHQEVERYYSLIDVLAYPRKRMRLTDLVTPLKPLEAMAQGRLVAASNPSATAMIFERSGIPLSDSRSGYPFPSIHS